MSRFQKLAFVGLVVVVAIVAVAAVKFGGRDLPEPASAGVVDPSTLMPTHPTPVNLIDAVKRPEKGPLRVLFIGDSLTDGFQSTSDDKRFAGLLTKRLSAAGPVKATVDGNPSKTTAEIAKTIPAQSFDLVVVEVGTNDQSKGSLARFEKAYPRFIDRIAERSPDAQVWCLGPWLGKDVVYPFNDVVDQTCSQHGYPFVDLAKTFTDEDNRSPQPGVEFADTFHPNNRGHSAIAKLIATTWAN